jgi:hypothetical protein
MNQSITRIFIAFIALSAMSAASAMEQKKNTQKKPDLVYIGNGKVKLRKPAVKKQVVAQQRADTDLDRAIAQSLESADMDFNNPSEDEVLEQAILLSQLDQAGLTEDEEVALAIQNNNPAPVIQDNYENPMEADLGAGPQDVALIPEQVNPLFLNLQANSAEILKNNPELLNDPVVQEKLRLINNETTALRMNARSIGFALYLRARMAAR